MPRQCLLQWLFHIEWPSNNNLMLLRRTLSPGVQELLAQTARSEHKATADTYGILQEYCALCFLTWKETQATLQRVINCL